MTKPSRLLITDIHLKKDNFDLIYNIFEQAIFICEELSIKIIYCLGDIFTTRIGLGLETLVGFDKILELIEEKGIHMYVIHGNHDKKYLDSYLSYLHLFRKFQCLTVINGDEIFFDKAPNNTRYYFLPYFKEDGLYPVKIQEIIESLDSNKTNILLTHIAISGVSNNDGSIIENDLKQRKFSNFYKVFVGHYHNKSKVGKNIFYIGSALAQNYGEDNDKGFTILNEDNTHYFIKSEFPNYIKIKLDANDVKGIEINYNKYKNSLDNVRFIFYGDILSLDKIDDSKFHKVGIDVKRENIDQIKYIEEAENEVFIEFDRATIFKEFLSYAKESEIPKNKMSNGLKLLKSL